MRHLTYGVVVESDLDLGVPTADGPPDVRVVRLPGPVDEASVEWLDRHSDPRTSAGAVGSDLYLRCDDDAEFLLSADGGTLRWHAADGPSDTLVHWVLDHVLPRALARLGRVVLHGSCAEGPAGAVAVLGRSGAGKSTLGAALLARGFALLADDCVVLERLGGAPVVAPAYPGLRLSGTSAEVAGLRGLRHRGPVSRHTRKSRMDAVDAGVPDPDRRAPLAALIVLDEDAAPVPAALPPATAGVELLRHSFHLARPEERAELVGRVLGIAAEVPVHRMRYDHSAEGLERACAGITTLLVRAAAPAGR